MTETKQPRTAAEWFEAARVLFHKPDGIRAVQALERVIDLDPAYRHPDGDNPYFYLGKIHEMEGRLDSALIYYTRALAIDSHDEESRIGRGSCYTALKRHEEAIADFSVLLDLPAHHRKVPRKHLLYAISENYRQIENWGQAIFWGKQALAADPGNETYQELIRAMEKAAEQQSY